MHELLVLQTIRLKGRAAESHLPDFTGLESDTLERVLTDAEHADFVQRGSSLQLTAQGRTNLNELLSAEREQLDIAAITSVYDEFTAVNTQLKEIVSAWQLREPNVPNDHGDAEYDQQVIARLARVHERICPLLRHLSTLVPRLAIYEARLSEAMARLHGGEHCFLASPLVDSYHQVWFELHQELIEVLGRTREQEAAEGRA
ncbi:hypothetical protein [Mycolicibacterium sp. XJ1819]